jgi:uncharacterized membrane protein YhiD involved in acid resistance
LSEGGINLSADFSWIKSLEGMGVAGALIVAMAVVTIILGKAYIEKRVQPLQPAGQDNEAINNNTMAIRELTTFLKASKEAEKELRQREHETITNLVSKVERNLSVTHEVKNNTEQLLRLQELK